MKSKVFKLALTACLAISTSAFAAATSLKDISNHWAKAQIEKMVDSGAVKGYPNGTFQPNKQITRAEFATIVNQAFDKYNADAKTSFSDVKESDWYYSQVASGKAAGFISGYPDNTFQPNKAITREEAATIVAGLITSTGEKQTLTFTDASQLGGWAKGSVSEIVSEGIMKGYPDGSFKPKNPITRAEAVVTLQNALDLTTEVVATDIIEGSVTVDGKVVDGATVKLFEKDSFEVKSETKTDKAGKYSFKVASGSYDLTAQKGSDLGYLSDVATGKDSSSTAEIKMVESVEVSGKLLDQNGKKVKSAELSFTTNPTFVTKTDSNGEFKLNVLPEKKYTVRALNPDKKSDGYKVVASDVSVGKTNLTLELKAPFTVASTGGGGGSSSPSTPSTPADVLESDKYQTSTIADPLGDTLVKVVVEEKYSGVVTEVKVKDQKATRVAGTNEWRLTLDGTQAIAASDVVVKASITEINVTTASDLFGDTVVIVKLNQSASSVTVEGHAAKAVEGSDKKEYRYTLEGPVPSPKVIVTK